MTTAHNDTEKSKIKNEQNTSDDDLEEETETEKQDPELVSLGPSLGLFCYPVLQAADILLYRFASRACKSVCVQTRSHA